MSETQRQREIMNEDVARKIEQRLKASMYLRTQYEQHDLDEQDRDEILKALGIFTRDDIYHRDLSVVRELSKRGLTTNVVKGAIARTPPSRAV